MSKKADSSIIAYKILTKEHTDAATNLQIESSFQECLTIGFGIADVSGGTDHDGFAALLEAIIADGLSVGAFDTKSGELVGVCFNKLHHKSNSTTTSIEENVDENMKHPATRDLMKFVFKIESSVDLYEHYGCNHTMEVFYVGVDSRYRRYGIAQNLMRSSLEMARKIARERALPEPEVAFGVFTSNYSQALAEKFGFEWLYSVNYDDYECYDGKMLSDRIGPVHKCAKLAARKL